MEHIRIGYQQLGSGSQALDDEERARTFLDTYTFSRTIPVKIYEMVFSAEGREYCLSTTSKDVFLNLGSLGAEGQRAFALLIYHRATMNGRALVTFPLVDGYKGYLCVASRLTGNDHAELIHIDVCIASDK